MIGCLWTRVRKQPIIELYFESEIVLRFYNLGASRHIIYAPVLCVRASRPLARLHLFEGSSKPSVVAKNLTFYGFFFLFALIQNLSSYDFFASLQGDHFFQGDHSYDDVIKDYWGGELITLTFIFIFLNSVNITSQVSKFSSQLIKVGLSV